MMVSDFKLSKIETPLHMYFFLLTLLKQKKYKKEEKNCKIEE